mmetsp:Transcript_79919/g.222626  ORF Transcript_79919/g.222626 Transcript_79919/m.222626 type:complete len:305 (+) Transcript_79919:514-1428(+)
MGFLLKVLHVVESRQKKDRRTILHEVERLLDAQHDWERVHDDAATDVVHDEVHELADAPLEPEVRGDAIEDQMQICTDFLIVGVLSFLPPVERPIDRVATGDNLPKVTVVGIAELDVARIHLQHDPNHPVVHLRILSRVRVLPLVQILDVEQDQAKLHQEDRNNSTQQQGEIHVLARRSVVVLGDRVVGIGVAWHDDLLPHHLFVPRAGKAFAHDFEHVIEDHLVHEYQAERKNERLLLAEEPVIHIIVQRFVVNPGSGVHVQDNDVQTEAPRGHRGVVEVFLHEVTIVPEAGRFERALEGCVG